MAENDENKPSRLEIISDAFGLGLLDYIRESPICRPPQFIRTGYKGIDDVVFRGGLPRGRKVELVGAPSEGKTSLALKLAESVILQGGAVAWFDAERVINAVNFSKQYTGYKIPLIQAIDAEDPDKLLVDSDGNPWMIPNPEVFLVPFFSSAQDMKKKFFTLLALDIFDLIVLDSIAATSPDMIITSDVNNLSQFEKFQIPIFWKEFFQALEGGFKAERFDAKKQEYFPILSNKPKHIFQEDGRGKTRLVEDRTYHNLEDKKACFLYINHLPEQIKVNIFQQSSIQTKTTGGRKKEYSADIRIIVRAKNEWKGTGATKKYLGKSIIIKNEKSRIGEPYGMTTVHLSKDGTMTDDCGQKSVEEFFDGDAAELPFDLGATNENS